MDDQERSTAESQLAPGERLIWWGKPLGAMGGAGSRAGGLVFMILWTLFAVFWTTAAYFMSRLDGAQANGDALFQWFPLFGVPFILIGCVGLFFQIKGMGGAMKTTYAVTDRRVIVVEGSKVTSYGPPDLQFLQRTDDSAGGRGTLEFAHTSISSGGKPTARLYNIPEAAKVEAAIRANILAPKT